MPTISLPHTYTIYDLETATPTGHNDPSTDRALQVGWVKVVENKVVEERELLVRPSPWVDPGASSRFHGITADMLAAQPDDGSPLDECMRALGDGWVVGWNILQYDNGVMQEEGKRYGTIYQDGLINPACCLDLGILYKACKMWDTEKWAGASRMFENETPLHYQSRISEYRTFGINWNLAQAVLSMEIEVEGVTMHRALADCQMIHKVMLEFQTTPRELTF